MPDPDKGNRQAQTDAEAHVKIEIIGKHGVDGFHARVPAGQDPVFIKNRIGHNRNDDSHQPSDNGPEGQHHADKNQSQVQLNTGGHRRQDPFGMTGQLNPGNGNQPNRLHQDQA